MVRYKLAYKNMDDLFNGLVRKGVAFNFGGGNYLVIIDERLDAAEKELTLKHELTHLYLGHCADEPATWEERQRREAEADAFMETMSDDLFTELKSYRIE